MPSIGDLLLGLAPVLAAVIPAAGLAWLLRAAHCPGGKRGAAIVAGAACGLLLSAGVMGRLKPNIHADLFTGGAEQTRNLERLAREQEAERAALAATDVTPEALDEHERTQIQPRIAEARALRREAMEANARRLDLAAAFLAGSYAALALAGAVTRSSRLWRRTGEHALDERWRDAARGGALVVLSASVPALAAWSLLGGSRIVLGVAAAFAAPGVVLLPSSLFIASTAGLLFAGAVAVVGLWTWPATVVVVMAIVGAALGIGREGPGRGGAAPIGFADAALLPGLAALVIAPMDPHAVGGSSVFIWTAVLAVLWSSDGRWIAGRLCGLSWRASNRVVSGGAAATQVILGAACGWAGVSDAVVAAIVLGALVIELSSSLRTLLADRMDVHPGPPSSP